MKLENYIAEPIEGTDKYILKPKSIEFDGIKKGRRRPKDGEEYWNIHWTGVANGVYGVGGYEIDCSTGNCYQTKEIAEAVLELKSSLFSVGLVEQGSPCITYSDGLRQKSLRQEGDNMYYIMPIGSTQEELGDRASKIDKCMELLGYCI